jgi:NADH-quinone oxidoreductase subunit L
VVASLAAAIFGTGLAAAMYLGSIPSPTMVGAAFGPLHGIITNKWYMDVIAENGLIRTFLHRGLGRGLQLFDTWVVDGAVNGLAFASRLIGEGARRTVFGQPQAYTSAFLLGTISIVGAILVLGGSAFEALQQLRP